MLWPIASTRGFSPRSNEAGFPLASRISRRVSRIRVRDSDGAMKAWLGRLEDKLQARKVDREKRLLEPAPEERGLE